MPSVEAASDMVLAVRITAINFSFCGSASASGAWSGRAWEISFLRDARLHAPVVLVTALADAHGLKAALNAGAAYLLERPFTSVALGRVLDQVTAVDLGLARLVNRALAQAWLTRTEEEVARKALKGLTSSEIGAMLGYKERTIKHYLTQVYGKLGVACRSELFHLVYPS
jgi:DNA-binding NarL/FixJ family response regulator